MKVKLHWALLFALALPSFVAGAEEDAKNAARVKWAKGVLDDFFDATFSGKCETAGGLLSPELAQTVGQRGGVDGYLWGLRLFTFDTRKVTSEEIDPDASEVVFKGELIGKEKKADFTARVAREGKGGKWSIRYFFVKEREEPVKPKPQ